MLKIVCNQHITKSSELNVQKLPSQASEYSGVKNVLELVLKCFKVYNSLIAVGDVLFV